MLPSSVKRVQLCGEVESFLREKLDASLSLEVFDTESSQAVFHAYLGSGDSLCVKILPVEVGKFQKSMTESLDLPCIAKVYSLLPWRDGMCILCTQWKAGRHIPIEDLNDRQLAFLADSHTKLVAKLRPEHVQQLSPDNAAFMECIAAFSRRHVFARPFLRPLLSIPVEGWAAPPEHIRVIHGDFHYLNYMFEGDEVTAIMDLESVMKELPTYDLAYNILRRYYKGRLSADKIHALDAKLCWLVLNLPYPIADWKVAMNQIRLRFAARRLEAHPKSVFAAMLVWRRDSALRRVVENVLRSIKFPEETTDK